MVGHVSNQDDLAMYYSAAKLTLLTSKRENFFNGMCRKFMLWKLRL